MSSGERTYCYTCGQEGHMSSDCPSNGASGSRGAGDRRYEGHACFRCGKEGHWSSECPTERPCAKCATVGHTFAQCPQTYATPGRGGTPVVCYKCGRVGHYANACVYK